MRVFACDMGKLLSKFMQVYACDMGKLLFNNLTALKYHLYTSASTSAL